MISYASVTDLSEYLHVDAEVLPDNPERILERASEVIEFYTRGRADETDFSDVDALKRATCAQVEYWIEVGEDVDLQAPVQSKTVKGISIQYIGGNPTLAPRAYRILLRANFLYSGAKMR